MHYFNIEETRQFDYNNRIILNPTKPKFHKDWEWHYDFPEVKRKLYQLILFFYKKILLYLLNKAKLTDFAYLYETRLNRVEVKDIETFIFKNLRDNQKISHLYSTKCAIIFGPDVRPELMKLTNSFEFSGKFKFQVNIQGQNILFFYEIPMIYLPTISGIHIIPDITGKWTEALQREEPTTYAKLRRY